MIRTGNLLSLVSLTFFFILNNSRAEVLMPRDELMPFFQTHCVECHGPDKVEGDLRFDEIKWSIDDYESYDLWAYVMDQLETAEMPTEDVEHSPMPSPEAVYAAVDTISYYLNQVPQEVRNPPVVTGHSTFVDHSKVNPFIEQHCVHCHGPDKQKGQVRLDTLSRDINNNDTAQLWQDVLDVLNSGEMPPVEEPRPPQEPLLDVMNSLTKTLVTARKRLTDHGGVITMRRLNRREYSNTIRELFGFEVSESLIPEDADTESYDTVGADQFFSSSHFELYYELGKKVAEEGFKWSGKEYGEPKKREMQLEKKRNKDMQERIDKGDRLVAMKEAGKSWKEMGFKDEGAMKIYFSQLNMKYLGSVDYMKLRHVNNGIYLGRYTPFSDRIFLNFGDDPRSTYRVKINAGLVNHNVPEARKFLVAKGPEGHELPLKIQGTPNRPQTVEFLKTLSMGSYKKLRYEISENKPNIRTNTYLKRIHPKGDRASIWVDWIEIEGPFYDRKTNFFGELLNPKFSNKYDGQRMDTDAKAREFIQIFAYEAFRRETPDPEFIDLLVAFFEESRAQGKRYKEAMGEVIALILASPSFLYIQETYKQPPHRTIDERSMAIRLAYFLWSSPPDDELYRVAESGKIFDQNTVKQQIRRMLNDRKADDFYEGFMSQWAELDRYEAISVDPNEYINFTPGVQVSAYKEVIEFFKTLVKENLPVHNLIDSDFVVINSQLANHYGLTNVNNNNFEKVSISSKTNRGGLITQTAFLTMGSNGERSSPVIRGTMVLDKILNDPPPPPPPNVPELGAEARRPLSNRQMVELHQQQTVCASCHSRIDPIGFGMENYNAIGQWRINEKVGKEEQRIQQGGRLVSGIRYQDINDLKRLLKTQRHKLAKELIESMLAYGLGRTIEFSDADQIDALVKRSQYDDFAMQGMIHKIVTSPLFTTK